jgi:hypothetical protein
MVHIFWFYRRNRTKPAVGALRLEQLLAHLCALWIENDTWMLSRAHNCRPSKWLMEQAVCLHQQW